MAVAKPERLSTGWENIKNTPTARVVKIKITGVKGYPKALYPCGLPCRMRIKTIPITVRTVNKDKVKAI